MCHPIRDLACLGPSLARALSVSFIRLCHLEVEWFSQLCPVVALDPKVPLRGHRFNDFPKTAYLMERGKSWTEDYIKSSQGDLLRSFAGH